MKSIAIVWAQYGPYHFARVTALRQQAGAIKIHALELANRTGDYAWRREGGADGVITICPDSVYEGLAFTTVFLRTRRELARYGIDVCLLPSYSPKQCLAALLAAKSLGVRTVMMNESHAGTARSGRLGTWVKRRLVATFAAALVGGQAQKRYFSSLGLPAEKIVTGYDAIDNDYFASRAELVRQQKGEYRARYALPERYFLSLGRLVPKKNLDGLLKGYRDFLDQHPDTQNHLVLVGAGEDEPKLRDLCVKLGLIVYEKKHITGTSPANNSQPSQNQENQAGVHFYGFRQIEENPIFYALAEVFILPSLYEEWGLVVNEAMAAGLPVIVSETAGSAEDLLETIPVANGKSGNPKLRCNGLVFDPASPAELAAGLALLATNASLREQMGQESRRIVEKFSCHNFAVNAIQAARLAIQ